MSSSSRNQISWWRKRVPTKLVIKIRLFARCNRSGCGDYE